MKDVFEKIRNNKVLKFIGNLLYTLLFVIVILMLLVVILQRASNNTVSLGGYRIFTVATGSMIPKYLVSDILVAKEISPADIQIGDDIVYVGSEGSFKDRVVTHQVIEKTEENGKYKFITKGIANTEQDPQITEDQVLGRIVYKVKTLSYISKLISNIYIFYFLIFVPIALIIFRQIRSITNSGNDDDDDDSDDEEDNDKSDDDKNDKK